MKKYIFVNHTNYFNNGKPDNNSNSNACLHHTIDDVGYLSGKEGEKR